MARPRKSDDEKRKLLSIRLDAEAKAVLESAAAAASRSVGAEAEARINATLGLDDEGLAVLSTIAREIQSIQRMTGKRWHRDLKTWSAVSEMMRTTAIGGLRPDQPLEDEVVLVGWEKLAQLRADRNEKIKELASYGITLPEEPGQQQRGRRGNTPLGNALAGLALGDNRDLARRTLDSLEPSPERDRAVILLDEIIGLDEQVAAADSEWTDLLRPYYDAEHEGRLLYRDRLKAKASRRRDEGLPYDQLHALGWFD